MSIVTAQRTGTKTGTFFVVFWGTRASYSETYCDFFFIRPTDPTSGNAFDAKREKGGIAFEGVKTQLYAPLKARSGIVFQYL